MDILQTIENVKQAPDDINKAVASKHYLHAIRLLKNADAIASSERLRSIKALHDIRSQFKDFFEKLPDVITDELRGQLHIQAHQKVLDLIDDEDQLIANLGTSAPVLANSPTTNMIPKRGAANYRNSRLLRGASSSFKEENLLMNKEAKDHEEKLAKTPFLEDNLSIDYAQGNPAHFMVLLIESLHIMNKLPELQSRLVQSLRYELRHLIEVHVFEFSNSLKNSDRNLLWLIIQNKRLSTMDNSGLLSNSFEDPLEQHKTNTGKAILQGKLIAEMMESLFIKLRKVLRNYQFVIGILEQKQSQKKDGLDSDDKELGSLGIILSKQVLNRIREAIIHKMEEIRNDMSDYGQMLFSSLDELLTNFIDRQYDESANQRVRVLTQIFDTQIQFKTEDGTRKAKQDAERAKSEFKELIIDTVSSPDTPRELSVSHVWKTIEDEVGSVLKELLGIRSSEMDNLSSKEKTSVSLGEKKSRKKTDFDFAIKFKFSSNVDYPLTMSSASDDDKNKDANKKTLCESMGNYFIFTPYNIIWMYRIVSAFAVQTYAAIGEEGSDGDESLLQDFMNGFIRKNFIPLIEEDYRNKLSKLLNDQDKHNTNAFLPRESPNQTASTYTYTPQTEKRPLLNSALFMNSWLKELLKISISLPMYKTDVFQVIETLLKQFLGACKTQFDSVINGKFIQQSLTAEYDNVFPVLRADPTFRKIYSRTSLLSFLKSSQPKKPSYATEETSEKGVSFYQKLFLLVDEQLQINYPYNLPKTKFIDNNSQLILLANLNDSLEWMAEQIQNYERELLQNEHFVYKQQEKTLNRERRKSMVEGKGKIHPVSSDSDIRKVVKVRHLRVTSGSDQEGSDSDDETSLINKLKRATQFLTNYQREYAELGLKCLFALKLDIRVHCYHFIHCNLMDNLLKYGTYECEDERKEPEDFINAFNQDLFRIERYLSCYLPKPKLVYLFESIERMILDLFIGSLPFSIIQYKEMKLDDMSASLVGGSIFKAPVFTKLGLEKMMRNIFSLQQQLSNFSLVNQRRFQLIRDYFHLLEMPSDQILNMIASTPLKDLPFTEEQYEAILQTPYEFIKRDTSRDIIETCRNLFDKKRRERKKK